MARIRRREAEAQRRAGSGLFPPAAPIPHPNPFPLSSFDFPYLTGWRGRLCLYILLPPFPGTLLFSVSGEALYRSPTSGLKHSQTLFLEWS